MSATKRFYEDCAEAGRCPISRGTWDYLDNLESIDPAIDWIGYCEHDYRAAGGLLICHDCITMESARRLLDGGLANAEIAAFVETFGDYCPA